MFGKHNTPVVAIEDAPPADTTPYKPTVLVVDDESAIADTLTEILSRNGYAAMTAYDAAEALEIAMLTPPELLITDVSLPGTSGIELAIKMRRIFPDCKFLLISGHAGTSDLLLRASRAGHTFTLLSKPLHPMELLSRVGDCLHSTAKASA
jgi:DNA-binding response OmpR family regulator